MTIKTLKLKISEEESFNICINEQRGYIMFRPDLQILYEKGVDIHITIHYKKERNLPPVIHVRKYFKKSKELKKKKG